MIAKTKFKVEYPADFRHVLIVDDDSDFAESLADILDLQGYKPHIANNPFEALKIIDEQHPHVALIDIRLGNSSGIDLVSRGFINWMGFLFEALYRRPKNASCFSLSLSPGPFTSQKNQSEWSGE